MQSKTIFVVLHLTAKFCNWKFLPKVKTHFFNMNYDKPPFKFKVPYRKTCFFNVFNSSKLAQGTSQMAVSIIQLGDLLVLHTCNRNVSDHKKLRWNVITGKAKVVHWIALTKEGDNLNPIRSQIWLLSLCVHCSYNVEASKHTWCIRYTHHTAEGLVFAVVVHKHHVVGPWLFWGGNVPTIIQGEVSLNYRISLQIMLETRDNVVWWWRRTLLVSLACLLMSQFTSLVLGKHPPRG